MINFVADWYKHLRWGSWPTWSPEKHKFLSVCLCVFEGITHRWVMNAALLMTLPTPQLLNLSARQSELQASPRCQERLISIPWSWWALTDFQTWPPPSSRGACVEPQKKTCSLPHAWCGPPTSFPWPHLLCGEISQPPVIVVALNLPLSHEAAAEDHAEWVNACK